jgi:hypothetical protein
VNADPEARAVIEALDVVKVELGQLGTTPAPPMPAHFAARLDAALDAEARSLAGQRAPEAAPRVAPVVDLAEARRRRNRRIGWAAGVLTAAAAAVAVTIAIVPGTNTTGGNPVAGDRPPSAGQDTKPPLELETGNLSAAIGGAVNEKDYGPLMNQARLDECIKANGLDPAKAQTTGVRQVMLDGKPGVLALLTTGQTGQFRVLVVDPSCGPGNPGTMANQLLPSR